MSKTTVNNNGIGILGLLGVLFVGLKLGGVISWSWWWVTAPFWGVIPLIIAGFIIFLSFLFLCMITKIMIGVFKK